MQAKSACERYHIIVIYGVFFYFILFFFSVNLLSDATTCNMERLCLELCVSIDLHAANTNFSLFLSRSCFSFALAHQ